MWVWGAQETLPSPPWSFLSLVGGAQTRKSQGQWKGPGDWESVLEEDGRKAWEISLCQKGVAHTALKHLACGDRERACPFLSELLPQLARSPTRVLWCGETEGERRTEASSGPSGGASRGLGKRDVLQSSVIPLALSSSCTRVR